VEQAPLLPTSLDIPSRVVFVKKVAAAQDLTPDFKRYLYATDEQDASAMVFDIGPNSTTRRPLQRAHPEYNPFQPRDRVKFAAPPADILVVERDVPFIDPVSGVAPGGMACNPDPNAVTCTSNGNNCDLGTGYRTSSDYTMGAAPAKLRGEFAYAALSNGKLAVIDIADFDSPCRAPLVGSTLAGCASDATDLSLVRSCPNCTSAEVSCNVVARFEPRAANYEAVGSTAGNHVPGIQTYPQLYNTDGSVFSATAQVIPPRMVATLPPSIPPACLQSCDPNACGNTCDTLPGCPLQTFVGGVQTPLDIEASHCSTSCAPDGAACESASECCQDIGGSSCTSKACTADTDCPSGWVCGTSAPQCFAAGTTCKKNADCCSNSCVAGVCQAQCTFKPCMQGSDCSPGFSCASGSCVKACTKDGDCPGGACGRDGSCTLGVCGPAACDTTHVACNPATQGSDCNPGNCPAVTLPSRGKAFTPGGIGANNALTMNLEDPRAQLVDQNWTVTFEGALPGFSQRVAYLAMDKVTLKACTKDMDCAGGACGPGGYCRFTLTGTVTDPFSRFCDSGVLGQSAVSWMLAEQQKPALTAAGLGPAQLADYVQVTNDLPNPVDPYWTQGIQRPGTTGAPPAICGDPTDPSTCECVYDAKHPGPCACTDDKDVTTCFCRDAKACNFATCDYSTCESAFGTIDSPTLLTSRDLTIIEAYQDHVEVVPRGGEDLRLLKCCFPSALTFAVRTGNQWEVWGEQVGFLHHVVASDATLPGDPAHGVPATPIGACRNSCDGTRVRLNGRLVETVPSLDPVAIADRAPGIIDPSASFQNPMFRFGIFSGQQKCTQDSDCPGKSACACPGTPNGACGPGSQGICAAKVSDATKCPMGNECSASQRCDALPCQSGSDCAGGTCSTISCTQGSDCPFGGACNDKTKTCALGACQAVCFHYGQPLASPTPRDSVFRFTTNGSFAPLLVSLGTDPNAPVEPQSLVYSKSTAELAVTDGSLSGLIFVSLTTPGNLRSFF
jgi:hypothetical protein